LATIATDTLTAIAPPTKLAVAATGMAMETLAALLNFVKSL